MANVSVLADSEMLSNDELQAASFWLIVIVGTILAVIATSANVINVIIFVYQGLKESMNFNLFCLSVNYLCQAVFTLSYCVVFLAELAPGLEFTGLTVLLIGVRVLFTDLGSGFVVFISLERCLCVTFPFKFKGFFKLWKCRLIMGVITIFVFVNYILLLSTFTLEWHFDESTNTRILDVHLSDIFGDVMRVNDLLFSLSLTGACQVCVFICAVLLFRALWKSSKARTAWSRDRTIRLAPANQLTLFTTSTLSMKEKRVVKMMFLVAVSYILTGLPIITPAILREVGLDNLKYTDILRSAIMILGMIDVSANIFIYYRFNSSFRASFRKLISRIKND